METYFIDIDKTNTDFFAVYRGERNGRAIPISTGHADIDSAYAVASKLLEEQLAFTRLS